MAIVHSGDMLACDYEQVNDSVHRFECDISGHGPDGEWIEKEDVRVSDLKIQGEYTPSSVRTGQTTRHTDRTFEISLEGATCGFGMSGWGGILQCSD